MEPQTNGQSYNTDKTSVKLRPLAQLQLDITVCSLPSAVLTQLAMRVSPCMYTRCSYTAPQMMQPELVLEN